MSAELRPTDGRANPGARPGDAPLAPLPDDLRDLGDRLVPGCWPTADIDALGALADRYRSLAGHLDELARAVDFAHTNMTTRGRLRDQIVSAATSLTDDCHGLRHVAGRVQTLAAALDTFGAATRSAQTQMTLVVAVADRDRIGADVAAAVGDDSAHVVAAAAGRLALTAAGDEYVDAAGQALPADSVLDTTGTDDDQRHRGGADDEPSGTPPAATAGMMPMGTGMMSGAGLLGAAGAAGGRTRAAGSGEPRDPERHEVDWLRTRAMTLQTSLAVPYDDWIRTAVGLGRDASGAPMVLIGTGDPQPYLRPGLDLRSGETLVATGHPPEVAIVEAMTQAGITPTAVAAASEMPARSRAVLAAAGIQAIAPALVRD